MSIFREINDAERLNYLLALRNIPDKYLKIGLDWIIRGGEDDFVLYIGHPDLPPLRCFFNKNFIFEEIPIEQSEKPILGKPYSGENK